MEKVDIKVGYGRRGLEDYKYWDRGNLAGVDVEITDGMGNRIEISSRSGDDGSRVSINGKTIFNVGYGKAAIRPSGTRSYSNPYRENPDSDIRQKIQKIVRRYDVEIVSLTRNIQGTYDVELDQNIYYKEQERMEDEIRELGLINDIFYRDVV